MLTLIIILTIVFAACLLPALKMTEHKSCKDTKTVHTIAMIDNSILLRGKN